MHCLIVFWFCYQRLICLTASCTGFFGQIVEFLAVLLKANSEGARQQLVSLGAIASVVNLLFEYVPHISFWIYCTVS
jgi:hypothetical protein